MQYSEDFSQSLLAWYWEHKRALPWRDCGDPYKIWISEIMLQQTRVDQAEPYYHRFIEKFPTVEDLANAEIHDVLMVWEGLGYYSRARNLHGASKMIVHNFNGEIPQTWEEITQLKGIGPYTASAVLSIAFDKPYAVVDGNVIRVLTRYFGIEEDVRRNKVKNEIQKEANELLSKEHPGDFNQALMELGAIICTPHNPDCSNCPLQSDCMTYRSAAFDRIPYKSPAKKRPHHHIGVGIIRNERNEVLIALRPEKAMLGNLWEFPGGKKEKGEKIEQTVRRELKEELDVEVKVGPKLMDIKHAYSHFKITLHAFFCTMISGEPKPKTSQEIRWVSIRELDQYPFPKANRSLVNKLSELD
ncbi:MAG TPA: A/G-specific adenine glycosylase [Balneolales bacterium]|nr:A/G-specific adenine glycosylase [Balneolales bacterium]